ncbi:MAG: hypothetical protein AAFU71_02290 [Cyanobacteria bacterium J06632_22]
MKLRSQCAALGVLAVSTLTLAWSQIGQAHTGTSLKTAAALVEGSASAAVPEFAAPRPLTSQEQAAIAAQMPVEGRQIISEHSFVVPYDGARSAAVVLSEQANPGVNDLRIDLFETDGRWIQTLPNNAMADAWMLWEVKAVSFTELLFDGPEPDVIVLAEYMVGAGPNAAQPFPVATVYLNEGGTFVTHQDTNDYLTERGVQTISEAEDVLRRELMYLP